MCHGRLSLTIVASPFVHCAGGATIALLMYPTRAPATFWIVFEWKLPSSVTLHLTLPGSRVSGDQVTLILLLLTLSRPADAALTANDMSSAAAKPAIRSLLRLRIRYVLRPISAVDDACRAWRATHGSVGGSQHDWLMRCGAPRAPGPPFQ